MKKCTLLSLTALLLTMLVVANRLGYAQAFNISTLMSPNEEINGGFGYYVANAGDVNQDGIADMIVGAYQEDPGASPAEAGRAYIFNGQNGSLLFTLISPNQEAGGRFGFSVSGAGDVNQDGFGDVIVGAYQEDPGASPAEAGRAYIFSGQNGSLLFELMSPNQQASGFFGYSVSDAGDVNQDGFADVVVGALSEDPGASPVKAGRAYIFSGQNGSLLIELVSPNEQASGFLGKSVSGAGDANQDGFADVIVGAYKESPGSSPMNAGRAYIFSGQNGSPLFELISPNEEAGGFLGYSVSGAGDVNQDGFSDVVVGAWHEDPGASPTDAGRVYIFSGQNGSPLFVLQSPNEELDGHFGGAVSGAGDVNQDGFADVVVGTWLEDPGSSPENAGRAYIFSGQNGSLLFELASPNEEAFGNFGFSVSDAGDVNQDGFAEVMIGGYQEDPGASPQGAGRAYIFVSNSGQPQAFRINSGGSNYTDAGGNLFVADQAYATGSFGYAGGTARTFTNSIANTADDLLYQSVRHLRAGSFFYRFDVSTAGNYDVTLYLMTPNYSGAGNTVMDVLAEGTVIFDNLDVNAQAGGTFTALIKTFTVNVNDGRLDVEFVLVNKAAVVSAIAVVPQTSAPPAKSFSPKNLAAAGAPTDFQLWQNYPNPFSASGSFDNPETEIAFQLPRPSHVRLQIFNALGQEIRTLTNREYGAGYHRVRWDGKDRRGHAALSGIYFYRLQVGTFSQVRKMSLQR